MTSPPRKQDKAGWRDHGYMTASACPWNFRTRIITVSVLRRLEAEPASRCCDTLEALRQWVTILNLKPHEGRRPAEPTLGIDCPPISGSSCHYEVNRMGDWRGKNRGNTHNPQTRNLFVRICVIHNCAPLTLHHGGTPLHRLHRGRLLHLLPSKKHPPDLTSLLKTPFWFRVVCKMA